LLHGLTQPQYHPQISVPSSIKGIHRESTVPLTWSSSHSVSNTSRNWRLVDPTQPSFGPIPGLIQSQFRASVFRKKEELSTPLLAPPGIPSLSHAAPYTGLYLGKLTCTSCTPHCCSCQPPQFSCQGISSPIGASAALRTRETCRTRVPCGGENTRSRAHAPR
jgi:hypothetical protein